MSGHFNGGLSKQQDHELGHAEKHPPSSKYSYDKLMSDVEQFAKDKEMTHILPLLRKGALVAQNPSGVRITRSWKPDERKVLREEITP
ncbi:hypothetical protein BV898_01974 [Hypsibius exemplaris]|uniref:Uncharacterized protein n=1 Tax=Hypsibius exemplaris TaxID=2072580 RepID=A0A1W0X915_HYPEX|nr:hypothetical protein BV898_01974 [Hypsibius exemplaris]